MGDGGWVVERCAAPKGNEGMDGGGHEFPFFLFCFEVEMKRLQSTKRVGKARRHLSLQPLLCVW